MSKLNNFVAFTLVSYADSGQSSGYVEDGSVYMNPENVESISAMPGEPQYTLLMTSSGCTYELGEPCEKVLQALTYGSTTSGSFNV